MDIRKSLIGAYLECQYIKKHLQLRLSKKISEGCIDNARERLTEISPKPVGYYKGICNKAVDDTVDLSIIVPVYNVEKYLSECLDSIVSQDTKYNYEVICVDDGSPDNSIDILYEYQKRYKCIRIIRQENRGFSGARNRGIDEAIGKYIMFVDSDDRIEPNMFQSLMDKAVESDYDIAGCGFYIFSDGEKKKCYLENPVEIKKNAFSIIRKYPCYFWGKVFKRTLFYNIRLPEGYWFEDMIMLHILTRLCQSFAYLDAPLYGYRINQQGISHTASSKKKAVDQYWLVEYIESETERLGLDKTNEYYAGLVKEFGPFLYSRTKGLNSDIRRAVFSAACDLVSKWDIDSKTCDKSTKRLLSAFKEKDFNKWQAVASTWH